MSKLTKEKAKEISIKKWEWVVDNEGIDDKYDEDTDTFTDVSTALPELKDLTFTCGYCELYHKEIRGVQNCKGCPINIPKEDYDSKGSNGCSQDKHPWTQWNNNECVETAQAVLDLIRKS